MATEACLTWDDALLKEYLKGASGLSPPPRVEYQKFQDASNNFLEKFPKETARVKTLVHTKQRQELTDVINSAYPVLHERCLPLLISFIQHKKTSGTSIEKAVYENMDVKNMIDRLLKKRPISFFAKNDKFRLRDGSDGSGGFEKIGTAEEERPLCLEDYLSYDEMKLSALLSVSSKSFFINNGYRQNKGVPGKDGTFQEQGIIVGMVGARLKKVGYMEWQDSIVTPTQNTEDKGYGTSTKKPHLQHLWARMWKQPLPEWRNVSQEDENFLVVDKKTYLNIPAYKARVQVSAETLLAEAKARATSVGLKAYIHVVGLGLGVWRASKSQDSLFVDAWGEALKVMDTSSIAHVNFSWIGADKCLDVCDGKEFPGTSTTIHFSKRALHDPVPNGTLLVVCFAWDGNSLPGNEYWIGKLCSTGDGAAACSSMVAEVHNTHINANVCGANLHVAGRWGVMHIAEYARRKLREK